MKCSICKMGETSPGHATVTLERGTTVVILRQVPAEVCQNCGEHYLSAEATEQVLAKAEDAVKRGAEVEIVGYAA